MDNEIDWFTTASITMLIVGIVVGLGLGYWWGHGVVSTPSDNQSVTTVETSETNVPGTDASEGSMTTTDTNTSLVNPPVGTSSIVVTNQAAGALALVSEVSLGQKTWVAVQDVDAENQLGRILGAQRLDAGAYNNVVVTLLRPMVAGNTYAVTLYSDNGDESFNPKTDTLMSSNGSVISGTFKTTIQFPAN